MTRPSQRREIAGKVVARHNVSIPLDSDPWTSGGQDLTLPGLRSQRDWGFGLCFLHLFNLKGHPWNHMA